MSLNIRRLDPIADQAIYRWAYRWLADSPLWRQQAESVFGTLALDDYMASRLSENRLDIGIFDGPLLVAKIALHLTAKHTYEVSLEAARHTNPQVIITASSLIRDQLFGLYGARLVYAWLPSWAKGVQSMAIAIGFQADGVIMAHGTSRGRLIEWQRYSLRATDE